MNDSKYDSEITDKEKLYSFISYIPPLFILVFTTEGMEWRQNLKKHAKQWVILFIIYLLIVGIIEWIFDIDIWWLVGLAYLGCILFLWFNAYNGKYIEIPLIKEFLDMLKK